MKAFIITCYAKKEADTKTYPKITSKINNFADYDVVFAGYPNWWDDIPRLSTRFSMRIISAEKPLCHSARMKEVASKARLY